MSNPDAYVREISSLDDEIKRLNGKLRTLREQKKTKQDLLYKYMMKNRIEKYSGITAKSIRPREQRPRKPESQKKSDAIDLFTQIGVENPEELYKEFKLTQKYQTADDIPGSSHEPKTKKKKDEEYDPFLGF
jgi:hypothetical protein